MPGICLQRGNRPGMAMVIINRGILITPDLHQGDPMDRPGIPLSEDIGSRMSLFWNILIVVLSCLGESEE
jgi:hypothetical protein